MLSPRRLLAVFAHPDDEGICGGVLIRNAQLGGRSTLICTTNGDVGDISDPALATRETLPMVRQGELRCSCQTMGIDPPVFLNYRDSGMAGWDANQHPQSLLQAPEEEVVATLVEHFRRLRPEIVITFDPTGIYGHPDHLVTHARTTEAYHRSGDPAYRPDLGAAWTPSRLFYGTIVTEVMRGFQEQAMRLQGKTDSEIAEAMAAMPTRGVPLAEIHVRVPVGDLAAIKRDALFCHRTQMSPTSPLFDMPDDLLRERFGHEYFIQADPPPPLHASLDRDLDEGLPVDS